MYLDHFELAVNPFGLSPKLDFLYKSSAFEESMAHLLYGLENSEAIVLITGPIGSGKTMAIQSFMSNLGPRYSFALVTNTQVSSVELLKLVLEDFGVSFPAGVDKSDLLILFKEFLYQSSREGRRVLVVIDEAQNLPRDVLEEIRLLTNMGQGESQPVQVILLGQPELETVLKRDDLAQLRQRIRVHYRLEPLSIVELDEYLCHRVLVAGRDRKIFTKDAVNKIYAISAGVPRIVNTLAGDSLLSAFVDGRQEVIASDVEDDVTRKSEVDDLSGMPVGLPSEKEAAPLSVSPDVSHVVVPEVPSASPIESPHQVSGSESTISLEQRTAAPAETHFYERRRPQKKRRVGLWVGIFVVVFFASVFALGKQDEFGTVFRSLITSLTKSDVEAPVEEVSPLVNGADNIEPELEPDVESTMPAQTGAIENKFFIHISSFRSSDRAFNLVKQLGSTGIAAFAEPHSVRSTTWYRVYVGPYGSHDAAASAADGLNGYTNGSYYKIVKIDTDSER